MLQVIVLSAKGLEDGASQSTVTRLVVDIRTAYARGRYHMDIEAKCHILSLIGTVP